MGRARRFSRRNYQWASRAYLANCFLAGRLKRLLKSRSSICQFQARKSPTRPTCPASLISIAKHPFAISAVDGLDYADASIRAVKMNVDGLEIKVLSLDDLIINKRSSGRPKDIADALTLEKLREKKNG